VAERPEISDETLITLLTARGYEVSKQRDPELASLAEKVAEVERRFAEASEASATPEDPRVKFATELRDRLNASMSKWYEPGGTDAA
jgi:hypothetical protein